MRMKPLLLLSILLGGCSILTDGPSDFDAGQFIIRTDRDAYQPGETAEVYVVNGTTKTFEFDLTLCLNFLQRREGSTWVDVEKDWGHYKCALPAAFFPPGDSLHQQITVQQDVAPGTYRFLFSGIRLSGGNELPEEDRVSNSFEITSNQ